MHDAAAAQEAISALPEDVRSSPLLNGDLAPVPPSRRTWSTYNYAALWIAMCHCIPTYTLAGDMMVKGGMNWWQAILTIGVGTMIVLVPILLNAHPGTKYGVPFPVLVRASYGTAGANFPAMLRAVVACGWFGINCYFGGEGVSAVLQAIWPGWEALGGGALIFGYPLPHMLAFMIFWALNVWIIWRGMEAVRVFENWAAPLVLVMAALLLVWLVSKAGFGPIFSTPSRFESNGAFFATFFVWVTGVVSFWSTLALNIPDFTRFGKGQKEQMLGQTLGLPTTMVFFSLMAVIITSAARSMLANMPPDKVAGLWDPVAVLSAVTSPSVPGYATPFIASGAARVIVALLGVVGVGVATVSVNIAANVVSPANDIANLAPRYLSFRSGGIITAVVALLMAPWELVKHGVIDWLNGYGALLGPIAGIMIVDYWVIRKGQLDVPELFRPNGKHAGVSWIAVAATVIGILPNIPGFVRAMSLGPHAPDGLADWIYVFAWFVGFFVAGGVYWAGTRFTAAQPAAAARPAG